MLKPETSDGRAAFTVRWVEILVTVCERIWGSNVASNTRGGFMRTSAPLWARGQDAFLVIRGTWDRSRPRAMFACKVDLSQYQLKGNPLHLYLLVAWYFAMFISFICLIFCNDYIFYSLDILQNVCFLLDNLQCFILYLPDILQSLYVLFAWYFAMFICTMPWFCQDQGRVMDTSRWRSWGPGRHAQRPGRGPSPGPTAVRDRCPTTCNSSNRW